MTQIWTIFCSACLLRLCWMSQWTDLIFCSFQYQPGGSWQGPETDVRGECETVYSADHHGVHKMKDGCKVDPAEHRARKEKASRIYFLLLPPNHYWQLFIEAWGVTDFAITLCILAPGRGYLPPLFRAIQASPISGHHWDCQDHGNLHQRSRFEERSWNSAQVLAMDGIGR